MSIAARRSHRGDDYQIGVAIHWLIQLLLSDSIASVDVEVIALPGETQPVTVDDIAITYRDGNHLFIQAKKNHPKHQAWSISDAEMRKELVNALQQSHRKPSARIAFWSHTPFSDLSSLLEAHNDYVDYAVFESQAPATQKTALTLLSKVISLSPPEAFIWSRCLSIGEHLNAGQWESRNHQDLEAITTDAAMALDIFERLARRRQNSLTSRGPIRRQDLIAALGERGVSVMRGLKQLSPEIVNETFTSASGSLLSWRSALPGGEWLERKELEILRQVVTSQDHSVTLLLGEPGSGKSSLLARLGQSLHRSNHAVLALKADQLPETIVDRATLTEALGLPEDIIGCLRFLASSRPIVVLIDQLDALADLVIQHSGRLRVLLQLIRDLAGQNNIHVVASCRSFEHRHDARLKAIDTDTIVLELPAWEQVAGVLNARGIAANGWNESIRNDLRSPHALDLFLQLLKDTDSNSLLEGYQQMLEKLWSGHVLSDTSGRRRSAAIAVASAMADREVLWLPQSLFDSYAKAINELVAAGILISDRGRLGFRHQTLYEFVRARDFVDIEGRLTQAVLSRQQSIRVRPLLWHTLGYMRSVDPVTYQREVERLWASEIRPHLRGLIIDFLGQARAPLPSEMRLALQIGEDAKWRPRILTAMAGIPAWFLILKVHIVSLTMTQPAHEAVSCLPFLAQGSAFDSDEVRELVKRHWLRRPEYDALTLSAFDSLPQWSIGDIDLLTEIASRSYIASWSVNDIAARISESSPELAPKFIRTWLDRTEQAADSALEQGKRPSETASDQRKRLQELIVGHELYGLSTIAERAPEKFLDHIWPWFLNALLQFETSRGDDATYHREEPQIDAWDEDRRPGDLSVVEAMVAAIEALATTHVEKFLAFVDRHSNIDQMIVQRLLAKGMNIVASTHAVDAADFLLADSRRMMLGSFARPTGDTKDLIKTIFPILDSEKRRNIESKIAVYDRWKDHPGDDAKTRLMRRKWNREHRLPLWRSIPSRLLSDDMRKHVIEEERALNVADGADTRSFEMVEIDSPITAEQMLLAQDAHILALFREVDDARDWERSSRGNHGLRRNGGAIQLGRELEKLTKTDPERGARIALQLTPGKNEIPAGFVIRALSEEASNGRMTYELIEKLVDKGFGDKGFSTDAAYAIEKLSATTSPPRILVEKLKYWLAATATHDRAALDPSTSDGKVYSLEDARSFLWGGDMMVVLPSGNFPLLSSLSSILLSSDPPNFEDWMGVLEAHLQRPENPHVWAALWSFLLNLQSVERSRAIALMQGLISKFPDIFTIRQGAILLGHVQRWAPSQVVGKWIAQIRAQQNPRAEQLSGEICALHSIATQGDSWCTEFVDVALTTDLANTASDAFRLGVAFAIAELWAEPIFRQESHPRLIALLRHGTAPILRAASSVFAPEAFAPEPACVELLDMLVERPEIGLSNAHRVAECLLQMVVYEPVRSGRAALALLNICHSTAGSVTNSSYLASEMFVNVAMALQEQGGDATTISSELFERILELAIPYSGELLLDLDRRMTNIPIETRRSRPVRRPRRRRFVQ